MLSGKINEAKVEREEKDPTRPPLEGRRRKAKTPPGLPSRGGDKRAKGER